MIEPSKILSVSATFKFGIAERNLYPANSALRPRSDEQADACLLFRMIDDQGAQIDIAVPFFTITLDNLEFQAFEPDSGPWQLL